jgi:hypothetical protein
MDGNKIVNFRVTLRSRFGLRMKFPNDSRRYPDDPLQCLTEAAENDSFGWGIGIEKLGDS